MSAKRRRSKRVSKSERVMLNLTEPIAIQDIVVTLEVSAHGAKVLARRKMPTDSRGMAVQISSGRQVPVRVAWQRPPGAEGRMETGLEIYSNTNFWGLELAGSELEPEPAHTPTLEPAPTLAAALARSALNLPSVAATIEKMGTRSSLPIDLWCALVDKLEGKGIFTRAELMAMLRKIGDG